MVFLMIQLSEENLQEEYSELYFNFYYDFAGDKLFSACKMGSGIEDHFNLHWLPFWKLSS